MTTGYEMMDDMADWAVGRPWRCQYRLIRSTTPVDSLNTITDMGIRMMFSRQEAVEQRGHAVLFMVSIMGLCVFAGLFWAGVL